MLRVGDALVQLLWYGGGMGRAIILSGLLAWPVALFGLAATLLRRSHASQWGLGRRARSSRPAAPPFNWGAVALMLAAFPMGLGAAATALGRMQAAAAAHHSPPGDPHADLLRQRSLEARLFSQGGLVIGAFPLVAGAAAILAAPARRTHPTRSRKGQAPDTGAAIRSAPSHKPLQLPRTALWAAWAVALVALVAALWGSCASIPDPDDHLLQEP